MIRNDKIYALYIRDKYICDGTLGEIAKMVGKPRKYIVWLNNMLKTKNNRYKNICFVEIGENDGIVSDCKPVIFKCEFCRNAIIYPKKLTARFCSKQCEKDFYNEQKKIKRWNSKFFT